MSTSLRTLLARNVRRWMAVVPEAATQAKLAARSGMSQSSIHRILNEATEPELTSIESLAKALGISIGTLLSEDEEDDSLPFTREQYSSLPPEDKEKVKAFIEFMVASNEAARTGGGPLTHKERLSSTPEDTETASRLEKRSPSNHALTNHVRQNQVRERKPAAKRK
ncbi:Helix-turn-helix [Paraburkholderia tropica]